MHVVELKRFDQLITHRLITVSIRSLPAAGNKNFDIIKRIIQICVVLNHIVKHDDSCI